MNKFSEWIIKKDSSLQEGMSLIDIVKQLIQIPCSCMSEPKTIEGTGPNEKSALKNALEKAEMPEDTEAELVDQDNDIYTFRIV